MDAQHKPTVNTDKGELIPPANQTVEFILFGSGCHAAGLHRLEYVLDLVLRDLVNTSVARAPLETISSQVLHQTSCQAEKSGNNFEFCGYVVAEGGSTTYCHKMACYQFGSDFSLKLASLPREALSASNVTEYKLFISHRYVSDDKREAKWTQEGMHLNIDNLDLARQLFLYLVFSAELFRAHGAFESRILVECLLSQAQKFAKYKSVSFSEASSYVSHTKY